MEALARRAAAPVFALAMFMGAALIFVLQPLFGRMVTPLLGGSPAVWNVSMAFFQAALLLGYLYAHLLARLKDLRLQAIIHAVVLLAAWFALPVRVSAAFGAPSSDHPALWLVGVLALSVGAPFAAISATAPLLQSWYARTGRADAHDPYYLYAASNLGSFVGLLAYPAIVEPLFGLHAQSLDWTAGYIGAAALIVLAASVTLTANGAVGPAEERATSPAPTTQQRLFWIAAAAIPSALILGVTLHITTDVASAPFLWVVPLALYLATFVIAFARGSEKLRPWVELIWPIALFVLVASYFSRTDWPATLAGNLFGFFMSALVCHLRLARSRPPADRLTEFYFFVSLGGVLGGAFAAFIAPLIFDDVYEYPLALAAVALFLRRRETNLTRPADASLAAPVFMILVVVALRLVEARDVAIIAGAVGAAAALIAAAWGEETIIPPYRYGFLISGVVVALVLTALIGVAFIFHSQTVFVMGASGGEALNFAQPWGWLISIPAFMTLLFATHASLQPRHEYTRFADYALGVVIPAMVMLIGLPLLGEKLDAEQIAALGLAFAALALFFNHTRPFMLAGLVLASFVIIFLNDISGERVIAQQRSFFGVLRTRALDLPATPHSIQLRILMHGTTLHGAQLHAPGISRLPLTYYNPNTSLGEAILAGIAGGDQSNIALIGLGTGTTACLTRPTDHLDIFEIDPAIVRLSTTPNGEFTYVPECQPHAQVHLGDARLQIAQQPDGKFDVIVVDAFSSDAIPAHLLTEQAVALYLRKTSARGIVILHLSNRNLALVGESARVANALHAPSLFRVSPPIQDTRVPFYGGMGASTMIIAKSPAILAQLRLASDDWRVIAPPAGRPWSDDYINLPRALYESLDGEESCRLYPDTAHCAGMRR